MVREETEKQIPAFMEKEIRLQHKRAYGSGSTDYAPLGKELASLTL